MLSRTPSIRSRSCFRAIRCRGDKRFSLSSVMASTAERAHAGRCLAVIQAFGQRVGWRSGCQRHLAASNTWRCRDRRDSRLVRRHAMCARDWRASCEVAHDLRSWPGGGRGLLQRPRPSQSAALRPGKRRTGLAFVEVGQQVVELTKSRWFSTSAQKPDALDPGIAFKRRHGGMFVLDHAGDRCRRAGWRCAMRSSCETDAS